MGSKTNARPHVLMGKCLFPNLIPRGRMQSDTKTKSCVCAHQALRIDVCAALTQALDHLELARARCLDQTGPPRLRGTRRMRD